MIKDPKGSNVMKSMTYANGDANSVDFLKREVTKLKAQLAEVSYTTTIDHREDRHIVNDY